MAVRRPPFPQNPQDILQPVAPVFPSAPSTGDMPPLRKPMGPGHPLFDPSPRPIKEMMGHPGRPKTKNMPYPEPRSRKMDLLKTIGLGSLGDRFGFRVGGFRGLGMNRRFPFMPIPRERATVVPRDLEQPAPVEQFGGTVVRRGPEFQDRPLDIGFGWERPFLPSLPMPMPSLTPEEITQQRIDQVSQFEQEPMMEPRYGAFGGSATNLPDYTTRTSRYPSVDWETIRPEGGHPLRFADAKFDPQRIGYADTGRRSDSGRPYALPGGYAGGGIADLINYYRR